MAATTRQLKTTSRRARILQENLTAYAFISSGDGADLPLRHFSRSVSPSSSVCTSGVVSPVNMKVLPTSFARSMVWPTCCFSGWRWERSSIAVLRLRQLWISRERGKALSYLIPGLVNAGAVFLFINWATILLPIILDIPQRVRGQERVPGLFVGELLSASFQIPEAAEAGNLFLFGLIAAVVLTAVWCAWSQKAMNGIAFC